MVAKDSGLLSSAAEYFVAYKLARLGFLTASGRQGRRNFDLLASNSDGSRTAPVQVKSSIGTSYSALENPATEPLLKFPLGRTLLEKEADRTIYCFVDFKNRNTSAPDVYVLPSSIVQQQCAATVFRKYSYFKYIQSATALAAFRDNWQPFFDALAIPNLAFEQSAVKSPPSGNTEAKANAHRLSVADLIVA